MPNVNDELDALRAYALGTAAPLERYGPDDPDGERVILRYGDVRIIDRGFSSDVALFLVTETRRPGVPDTIDPPAETPFSSAIATESGESLQDAVSTLVTQLGIVI